MLALYSIKNTNNKERMESLVVILAASLWTLGRYRLCTELQWQAKHWFIKGIAITLSLFPAMTFWSWDRIIASSLFSKTEIIYCEITMRMFLIVVAIQAVVGIVFIVSTLKSNT